MDCFDKIIGYESIKSELRRICDTLKNTEKYKKLGVYAPRGLMISGDPGLGKSLMANCLIEESGRKFFVCRKDKADGDFIDFIKKTFEEAMQNQPSIVFLDDVDKFANDDEMHLNSEEYVTIQSCIDNVKGSEVFVLATANNYRCFPDSLIRPGRFDYHIKVNYPTLDDSKKIIEFYVSQKKCQLKLDLDLVSKILQGHSCAELETVINEAGIYAGYENKKCIEMNDFIKATMRIIFNGPESLDDYNDESLKRLAYHEAGHAVIKEYFEPKTVNIVSICKYDSGVGGITSASRSEDYFFSKELMEQNVITLFGGKAASEIVLGEIDTGAIEDTNRTYNIIERFVKQYGIYGFEYFESDERRNNFDSIKTQEKIGGEMTRLYEIAKQILIKNKVFLDNLAKVLMQKKVVLRDEIQTIKTNLKIV